MKKDELSVSGYSKDNMIEQVYLGSAEKTVQESSYVEETQDKPFNPDDLYKIKGGLDFYEEMVKDDQVSVALQLKKDLVIGSGYNITAEADDQGEIIDDLWCAISEDPDVPFEDSLEEILTAFEFGYSVTEKIFRKREDGSVTLKALKTRHPDSFIFYTDEKGNLKDIRQRGVNKEISLDPKSLIHYVNNRRFQNPYGRSDLRPAYEAWFAKRQVVRYYGIFMEKYASPTPVASYNRQAPKEAVDKIFSIIKKFQTKTAITHPEEIKLDFLTASNDGKVYRDAIDMFNMFIGRSLMIPDLLGFQGGSTEGGSYSLGKEQIDIFFQHINRRRRTLEGLINKHIIEPIILFNWGELDNYPKFELNPVKEEDVKDAAKIWIDAVRANAYKPNDEEVNHFRTLINFPEGDVERQSQRSIDISTTQDIEKPKTQEPEAEVESDTLEVQTDINKETFTFKKPEGDYHKKVDFKGIANQLENLQNSVMDDTRPVTKKIFDNIIDQIQKKKILEKRDIARINTIKIPFKKELEIALKEDFKTHYKRSKKIAQNELLKVTFAEPIVGDEFLKFLETENFNYIGDWEYRVSQNVRNNLVAAVKDGKKMSEVEGLLRDDMEDLSKTSLERYSRTKGTEIMNKARVDFFQDSGIVKGYQYSAILDGRTTVICAGLHGKKFKADKAPIPPLHFNCRSVLVPITMFEDFKPDKNVGGQIDIKGDKKIRVPKKSIDKHIKDNLGKGFGEL